MTVNHLLVSLLDHLRTRDDIKAEAIPLFNFVKPEQAPPYAEVHIPQFTVNKRQNIISAEVTVHIVSAHRGDSVVQRFMNIITQHMTLIKLKLGDAHYSVQSRLDKTEMSALSHGRTAAATLSFTLFAVKAMKITTISH